MKYFFVFVVLVVLLVSQPVHKNEVSGPWREEPGVVLLESRLGLSPSYS